MCIIADFKDIKIAKEDIIAYKVVTMTSDNIFLSEYDPWRRAAQHKNYNTGKVIKYKLNKKSVSRFKSTFGIYCYINYDDAYNHTINEPPRFLECHIIKVIIPKETKYVTGYDNKSICAEEIIPIEQSH